MIITNRNGRRSSVFGEEDASLRLDGLIKSLSEDERKLLRALEVEEFAESVKFEKEIREHYYAYDPVSIEQFIEDPYYIGESCDTLYPALKKDIIDLFSRPYQEVLFTGSIGYGKTFLAKIAICRVLYELSCLINPQRALGLATGTEILIPLISRNLVLARDVIKSSVDDTIRLSPYFMTKFAPDIKKEYSKFPNGVKVVIGSYTSERVLGTNMYSAVMDECLTKKIVVTIENDGIVTHETVEKLFEIGQGDDNCKMVCFDHDSSGVVSGWWRIKKSTVQPIVRVETPFSTSDFSHGHPLLVKRNDRFVYVCARDLVVGDHVLMEVGYAEKRSEIERGSEEENIRHGEGASWGEEPVFWEKAFGRDEENDEGKTCKSGFQTEKSRVEGLDEQKDEGSSFFGRNIAKDEGVGAKEGRRSGVEEKGIGEFKACKSGGSCYSLATCHEREGQSELWKTLFRRGKNKDETGCVVEGRLFAYRRLEGENIEGECSFDKGQSEVLQVSGKVSLREGCPVSNEIRVEVSRASLPSWFCCECFGGRSHGVDRVRHEWEDENDSSGFHGDIDGRKCCDCGRKVPILFVLGKRSIKVFCDVELLFKDGLQDDSCVEQQVIAGCVERSIRYTGFCGHGDESSKSKGSIDGIRPEWIDACDVPSGFVPVPVTGVSDREPEQTYSICTEYKTFIADGIIVHNTNFPPRRSAQQIETGFGQRKSIANYDIVEKVYRTLVRRVKSRFQRAGGGFSGMIILVSSAATVDSFTERKIREGKEDPNFFVRDNTQWTVKPEGTFCGEKFYILCSTSSLKSRILKDDEYDLITDEFLEENDYWIVDVPIEFREDFESDMENAMRDIAGISTQAISAYIQRPQKVLECVDEREHPFTRTEWIAGGPGGFNWELMVNEAERRLPGGYMEKVWSPKINPSKMRWCHIDTSLSGDSTGFCVGHIDKWVEVLRRGAGGDRYTDIAPYYIIDFILRINPPPSEQIYMPDLRMLIYQLQEKGYRFLGLSTDSYQSAEMHQQVRRKGITPHLISMDRTTEPYDELKSAIYENRIKFYKYQPFLDELKLLEYDRVVGKIDHPVGGEKDTSDAVAGVVWGLKENMSRLPMGSEMGAVVERHVSKHGWVSNLVAADSEEAKEMVGEKSSGNVEFMPIILGD